MKLLRRPWKMLACAVMFTVLPVFVAWQIAEYGEIELRHWGVISPTETPIKFGLFFIGWLGLCALAAFLWMALVDEWKNDPYRPRWKPEFEDPEDRRPM